MAKNDEIIKRLESIERKLSELNSSTEKMENSKVAVELLRIYFSEIASIGFKRQLKLADIVSAYRYALNLLNSQASDAKAKEQKSVEGQTFYVNSKGEKYYLHKDRNFYFFSKDPKNAIPIPKGYVVEENPSTALPVLRKKK